MSGVEGNRALLLNRLPACRRGNEIGRNDPAPPAPAFIVDPLQEGSHIVFNRDVGVWAQQVKHLAQYPGQIGVSGYGLGNRGQVLLPAYRLGHIAQRRYCRIGSLANALLDKDRLCPGRYHARRFVQNRLGQDRRRRAAIPQLRVNAPGHLPQHHRAYILPPVRQCNNAARNCRRVVQQFRPIFRL